jgi:hypothetical protein
MLWVWAQSTHHSIEIISKTQYRNTEVIKATIGGCDMAKRVIEIQSPEEAEILKATREKIKALRAKNKKDADRLSSSEHPELVKIKKAIGELLKSAVTEGKIDKAWSLKRLAQVGDKQPKNWATKRRAILGLAKKRKKKVVEKEAVKARETGK